MKDRVMNLIGISFGGIGVLVGLSTQWQSWTWLSLIGMTLCLIATPFIWRTGDSNARS